MRECPSCGEQDLAKFGKSRHRKDGLSCYCISCLQVKSKETYRRNKESHARCVMAYSLQRKEENRRFLWEYKLKHPCVDCGETDPRVLQFDHVRGTKKSTITELAYSVKASIATLILEISKCEVRCANCHIRRTWVDLSYKEPENVKKSN